MSSKVDVVSTDHSAGVPEGSFLTYGIGVSLMNMANPRSALARVPVE